MSIPSGWSPEQARKRLEAATPGPWEADDGAVWVERRSWMKPSVVRAAIIDTGYSESPRRDADAAFIAHAPTDIAALLALLDDARKAMALIAARQPETLAMIRDNGFVFDAIGREPGNWQHLAFSIYTDLCEVESIASAFLARFAAPEDEA